MRIGVFFPSAEHPPIDQLVALAGEMADRGLNSVWLPQNTSFDALTALAVIGRHVSRIELGTAVIPTYPRHPGVLAAQALTCDQAVGGRLALGIGLSHKMSIEGRYGLSYERPARHMQEYLSILVPLLRSESANFEGETLTGRMELAIQAIRPVPVYLAALQPAMLRLAGSVADGTITWCTGPVTLSEQIVPVMTEAATEAGRPAPRVVVALPCCVSDDEAEGRAKADMQLDGYGRIPVYRAVLDREGVENPGDVSVVGTEPSVTDQLRKLEEIGATDFVAILAGTATDRLRTLDHLATLAAS
jgi:F420-dependent oxidoreductase-like protein